MSRQKRRKIYVLLLAAAKIVSLMGCGSSNKKSNKTMRVGVVTYTADDPFINAMIEKVKSQLKTMETTNMNVIVSVRSGDNDQREQDEIVDEMIDAGCDVLCVNLVDRTAPANIIKSARQSDIPVIFFNREPVRDDLMQWEKLYYVGCDAKESGDMQGEIEENYIFFYNIMESNGDGKIQYVLLEGEAGHQDAISRTDCSVKTIMDKGVDLEKLSYQFADWNRGQAENRMTQLISQYGSQIELVISNNDEMALGAVEAYDNSSISRDKRPVNFGIDGLDDALQAIKQGNMQGTVYNDKEAQAGEIARLAVDLFKGNSLDGFIIDEG